MCHLNRNLPIPCLYEATEKGAEAAPVALDFKFRHAGLNRAAC